MLREFEAVATAMRVDYQFCQVIAIPRSQPQPQPVLQLGGPPPDVLAPEHWLLALARWSSKLWQKEYPPLPAEGLNDDPLHQFAPKSHQHQPENPHSILPIPRQPPPQLSA